MLTSKHRAFLRSLSTNKNTILMIGKGGTTDQVVKQANDALTAHEIIKCKVLDNCESSSNEISRQVAEKTKSEVVHVIGRKFVLYRRNDKDAKIKLV